MRKLILVLNKKIYFLLLISIAFGNSIFNSSIYEKQKVAEAYYESNLYDDALIIYEEILDVQKSIFNQSDLNLLKTIKKIYELYTLNNDISNAKKYLQEYINVQTSYIIQLQKSYIEPLNDLKNIYINEKESELVFRIDSLLTIINTNMDQFKNDSLFTLPKLLINTDPNYETDTEYSINDYALEKMKEGFNYLNDNQYDKAIVNFNNSLMLNAKSLDFSYFKNINFFDKEDTLYSLMLDGINMDTTITSPYFYLGLFNYHNNKYDDATKYFNEYNLYYPEDINALFFLGKINLLQSNWLDAIFYFYRGLKINPNSLYGNLALAKTLIQIEDYDEAIKILKYILKKNSDNYELVVNLGISYYFIQNYEGAIEYLTQALLLNSEDYNTYYYLGLAHGALDFNKKGLDAYKKCVSINSTFGPAHYEMGRIYELILNDDKAIQHFELAKKNISFDSLNYKLAMIYYKNELFLKAMSPMKNYIINNLDDFPTLEILGDIFIKINRYSEAIDIYSRLVNNDENNEIYYLHIANSYYKLDDFKNAIIYYTKVIELDDSNHEVLSKIGLILNKQELFGESEKYLNQAIECGHPNKELLVQLAQSYAGQQKFLQSMLAFKEALQFSLEDPIIHYQLGIIYKELNMFNLAIDNFLFFIKTNEDDEITYFLIGECYAQIEDYQKAIKYFNKSYRINNSVKSLFKIGRCYTKSNDMKNAIKYFKRVIKKNPDHVKARSQLIKIYQQLGKNKDALKECEIIYMLDRSIYNSTNYCIKNNKK